MRISTLAFDYDGTLAEAGKVAPATRAALRRAKASARRLLMVTGRELPQLAEVFADLALFDAIVGENGAVMWRPDVPQAQALAPPPPPALVEALRARAVEPLSIGVSILATSREHAPDVEAALAALGLDWRLILNKDSVMCLPPGVDKASGLAHALAALNLAAAEVLGVGDAENDHPFLAACGVSAAVANALPALKADVDVVAEGEAGAGVVWLIEALLGGRLEAMLSEPLAGG